MKFISYGWFDEGIIGDAKFNCDCGYEFIRDTVDFEDDISNIIVCPTCGKREKLVLRMEFKFEKAEGNDGI